MVAGRIRARLVCALLVASLGTLRLPQPDLRDGREQEVRLAAVVSPALAAGHRGGVRADHARQKTAGDAPFLTAPVDRGRRDRGRLASIAADRRHLLGAAGQVFRGRSAPIAIS
jgi:hypothetical protein